VALVFYKVPKEYPQLYAYCVINILMLLHKYFRINIFGLHDDYQFFFQSLLPLIRYGIVSSVARKILQFIVDVNLDIIKFRKVFEL